MIKYGSLFLYQRALPLMKRKGFRAVLVQHLWDGGIAVKWSK